MCPYPHGPPVAANNAELFRLQMRDWRFRMEDARARRARALRYKRPALDSLGFEFI